MSLAGCFVASVAVMRVLHDIRERVRGRQRFSIFCHSFDMQGESLHRHASGFVQGPARGHAAWEIRKIYAEVTLRVLADQADIAGHDDPFSLIPDCFSMLRSVPMGRSRLGCGTVTRPAPIRPP
jgi:hypothetical protein